MVIGELGVWEYEGNAAGYDRLRLRLLELMGDARCGARPWQARRPAFASALLRVWPIHFFERPILKRFHCLHTRPHTPSTMPKVGKPISKRTSTRLRNSIQKKSAEKQRKLRKQAKNVCLLFENTDL